MSYNHIIQHDSYIKVQILLLLSVFNSDIYYKNIIIFIIKGIIYY